MAHGAANKAVFKPLPSWRVMPQSSRGDCGHSRADAARQWAWIDCLRPCDIGTIVSEPPHPRCATSAPPRTILPHYLSFARHRRPRPACGHGGVPDAAGKSVPNLTKPFTLTSAMPTNAYKVVSYQRHFSPPSNHIKDSHCLSLFCPHRRAHDRLRVLTRGGPTALICP